MKDKFDFLKYFAKDHPAWKIMAMALAVLGAPAGVATVGWIVKHL